MWMFKYSKAQAALVTPESTRELPTHLTWDSPEPPVLKPWSPRSSQHTDPSGQQDCHVPKHPHAMQSVWFPYLTMCYINCTLHHIEWNKKVMGNCCFIILFIHLLLYYSVSVRPVTVSRTPQLIVYLPFLHGHCPGSLNYSKGPLLTKVWRSCKKFLLPQVAQFQGA